jgi:PAS domain S-box-containing protein
MDVYRAIGAWQGDTMKQYNKDDSNLILIKELTDKLNNKERELIASNNRFFALFNHSPLGMMITVNRHIKFANTRMHTLAGYGEPELIGKSTRILYNTDKEFEDMGRKIKMCNEFIEPINLKTKQGGSSKCILKYTKCDQENYISVYIEAGI